MREKTYLAYVKFIEEDLPVIISESLKNNMFTTTMLFTKERNRKTSTTNIELNHRFIYEDIDPDLFGKYIFAFKSLRNMYGQSYKDPQFNFFIYIEELIKDYFNEVRNINKGYLTSAELQDSYLSLLFDMSLDIVISFLNTITSSLQLNDVLTTSVCFSDFTNNQGKLDNYSNSNSNVSLKINFVNVSNKTGEIREGTMYGPTGFSSLSKEDQMIIQENVKRILNSLGLQFDYRYVFRTTGYELNNALDELDDKLKR